MKLNTLRTYLFCLAASLGIYAGAVDYTPATVPYPPKPWNINHVANPDHIHTDSELMFLNNRALELRKETGVQLMLVSVKSIGTADQYQFAYDLLLRWNSECVEDTIDLLMLFVYNNHDVCIVPTPDMEERITMDQCRSICNSASLLMKIYTERHFVHLMSCLTKVSDIFEAENPKAKENGDQPKDIAITIICSLFMLTILVWAIISSVKNYKRGRYLSLIGLVGLSALMSSCGKSTQTAQTTLSSVSPDTDFVEVVRGRTMDEVTVEEVERLYYNNGGYNFNVAGYDFTFVEYLKHNPATMHYDFNLLRQADEGRMYIEQTPDGRIRIYSWCSDTYGTYASWNTLIQIEDNDSVYVLDDIPDWDTEVSTIEHVYQLPKTGLYIFVYYLREWASRGYYAAVGYELNGHTFKRVRLFADTDATRRDRLDFEYNTADYYFRIAQATGSDDLFYFDDSTATLYYPQTRIREEDALILADRYIPYSWDGTYMIEQDETGNPHLNPALQDYAYVDRIARFNNADSVIARIDVLPDGSYRYASWINEPMTAEPAMVLYHGTEDDQRYYFRNETHTYVITKDDCPVLEIYNSVNPYVQH